MEMPIIGYVVIDDTDGEGGCIIAVHNIVPQPKGYTDYDGMRYGTDTIISHRHFEKLPVYATAAEAQVACAAWVR
jgi:hypothetical protein